MAWFFGFIGIFFAVGLLFGNPFRLAKLIFLRAYTHFARRRLAYIQSYQFPDAIDAEFRLIRPTLDDAQRGEVLENLRRYLLISAQVPDRIVACPTIVLGEIWQCFVDQENDYRDFAQRAFRGTFVATPETATVNDDGIGDALRLAWTLSCRQEHISPRYPQKLPDLFSLDARLEIDGGKRYSLDRPSDDTSANDPQGSGSPIPKRTPVRELIYVHDLAYLSYIAGAGVLAGDPTSGAYFGMEGSVFSQMPGMDGSSFGDSGGGGFDGGGFDGGGGGGDGGGGG